MIIDILLEEAIRLIRPCTWLVPEPNSEGIAAVWGGDGIVNPPVEPHEHLMTFDCRFLPSKLQDITGCISVYQDEDDEIAELVRHESTFKLPLEMSSSIKLYPFRTTSLPPIEAIFRYGSDNTKDPSQIKVLKMPICEPIKRKIHFIYERTCLRFLVDGISLGQMVTGKNYQTKSCSFGLFKMQSLGLKYGATKIINFDVSGELLKLRIPPS
jgi:hypothetical protein